ncbi:phage protein Gp37 [Azonexus sp.]|uniref:phage protein Gp37 n=1 Tax=Azonexus sp. TaxID=1872668 RepID=UPI0035B01255
MLAELETGLVALIKASALGSRLRQVDSLPDLEGDSLIGRFTTDAPAVYVALGSFPVRNRYVRPRFGIACVARNSRGHQAARHGDGVAIGLYEMLDAVMALMDGAVISYGADEAAGFEVTSCDQVASEPLFQKGLYVGVLQIQAVVDMPMPPFLDESSLAVFQTFHADFDIEPHQPAAEHAKWLHEPADYSSSAPELPDTLTLPQE